MTPIATAVNTLATRAPGAPLPVDEAMSLLGFVGHTLMPVLPQFTPTARRPELREVLERLAQATALALEQLRPGLTPVANLVDALKAGDAPSRLSAAQALAERGPESGEAAGVLLQAALNDADPVVRLQAAVALYRLDGRVQVVLPLLVRALSDPSDAVCWYAADCLRQIGAPAREASAAVREALERPGRVALVRRSLELARAALEQ